jgi:hypothetical protein
MVRVGMASMLRVWAVSVCAAPLLLTHCTLTEDLDPDWLAEHAVAGAAGEAGQAGEAGAAGARPGDEAAGAGGMISE